MTWLKQGIELPFTGGFCQSRTAKNTIQECVNYRPNINTVGGVSGEVLYQTEGIDELIASDANEPCRGSHTMNGICYKVIGTTLFKVEVTINPDLSETWSKTSLGTILGSGRVIMKSIWSGSGYEMAIVDPGNYAYSYRETTGSVADLTGLTNFLSPVIDVESINGFMVFVQEGTNKVFHSNLNDISTYNALDFETVTRVPLVKGLLSFRGQLYVFGENETLPYTFIGGANFVFAYQPNSTLPGGIQNQYAKTVIGGNYFYLGGEENESPAIYMSTGGYPQKISNEAMEYLIRGNSLLSESFLLDFAIDGGKYVGFYIDRWCFVLDIYTQRWHTRSSSNDTIPWRANTITKAYGRLIVGDSTDGRIGQLSNSDTEYGDPVNRYFVTQPFDNKGRFLQMSSLLVVMDTGFNGDLVMSYSDDGLTWSDPVTRSAGSIGDYGRAVEWDRLGTIPYSRSLKIGTSAGVKANISKVLAQ